MEKAHGARSRRKQMQASGCPLWVELHGDLFNPPSEHVWQYVWSVANSGNSFLGGQSCGAHMSCDALMTELSSSHSSPPTLHLAKTNIHHKLLFRVNISNNTGIAWPKASGIQKYLSGRTFLRLRSYLPPSSQLPVLKTNLPLECTRFEQTRHAKLTLSCPDAMYLKFRGLWINTIY